jgi:hypothetical protein
MKVVRGGGGGGFYLGDAACKWGFRLWTVL